METSPAAQRLAKRFVAGETLADAIAVTRIGGQTCGYVAAPKDAGFFAHQVAVTLGDPIGNIYPVIAGLKTGDKVITSGTQFLQEGFPVHPLTPQPTAAPAAPPT